jgi:hypothetical protein
MKRYIVWGAILLIIILLILLLSYSKENYHNDDSENPTKFGLILRSRVPKNLKMALNVFNDQHKIFKITQHLPDNFDCRQKWPGLITGPMDQADCGSCWAFAIGTSSADRIRISRPNDPVFNKTITYRGYKGFYQTLNNLDPFHLAACDLCSTSPVGKALSQKALCGVGPESAPCKGEILQVALQYVKSHGMIDTFCSPRQKPCLADPDLCFYSCDPTDCRLYKPLKVHPLTDDFAEEHTSDVERTDLIRFEIMNYGPVVVGYKVTQSFMNFFKNPSNAKKVFTQEIADNSNNDKVLGGHAVVAGGWGIDENTGDEYWLIRNSWGDKWADEGWFRLQRGINFMGIGNDVWATHWATDVI